MPLRFFAKGLHEVETSAESSLASVCSASQAFSAPKDKGASAPPAIATSRSPLRSRIQASPIDNAEDEQAVENVKLGPVTPYSMPIQAAGALVMPIKIVNGLMRSDCSAYSVW